MQPRGLQFSGFSMERAKTTERDVWWSVQIFYEAENESRGRFRATAVYQVEAASVGEAIAATKAAFDGRGVKIGSIMPGQHVRFP